MNAIELSHVCKAFPGFAIQDLSLTVPSGTICGLVGENGAGKTTAIRLMMGALRPDSGRCTLLGVDTASPQVLTAKEDVGVVLDEAYFPETLNAVQVGKILAKTYRRWDKHRYDSYLDRFSLPRDKQFKDFSRGMKMKLAIASALAHDPKLLVLDEATAGLDPIVRDEVLDLLLDFVQDEDHAVLVSSHITSDLEKVADYITFLHQGKLVFTLEKDLLVDQYGVLHCGAAVFDTLDPADILAWRREAYQYKVLVRDRYQAEKKYPQALVSPAAIEDTMLFYVKGEVS